MNKFFGFVALFGLASTLSAQYMIIGNDSISLNQFKTEYKYGLENAGIEKTIASTQNFHLFQQFAAEKKADTLASFREKMAEKEAELRSKFFFPSQVIDPILNGYIKDNQTEKEVQVFILEKKAGDTNNYQQVYNDVKAGKLTMEEAITKYTQGSGKALYIKPGSLDNLMYNEVKTAANNTYTKFFDTPSYVGFAKVLNSRPSLGYLVFGTITFPKNENAAELQQKIYADLKAGKSFQEVAKLYGANENEKQNGGVILGSPTLPNEVYELFKGQKAGYYTPEPVLYNDNYYVFNLYSVDPYVLNEKNRAFLLREMNSTLYAELVQDKLIEYLKSDATFKEFPAFQQVKKSYANFAAAKDSEILYQYKKQKVTVGDLRKMLGDKKDEAAKLSPTMWSEALTNVNSQDLLRIYSQNFIEIKEVKAQLAEFKKGLYSDFILTKYLSEEIAKHPEWLTEYYNQNKSKFMWGERADGRVAIIADPKLVKEISKEIKTQKGWEAMKTKYGGKLNDQKQILVAFETGEMAKEAEVFTKYKVPFKTGVFKAEVGARTLVIAIDKILAPEQMSQQDAIEEIKDAVNEQKMNEIIATQKAKTKISVQPEFMKDLEKNFKK
ncbi:hypothetical protein OA84_10355 [Kaistella solincola]|uniref:Peptidylprolyl isomerase n=1 Tax=Kaistella solincola TaxID=510955 RepID=A0ABR4ZNS5_9FLAO|nr:hypothetical protein [Kaistella solincola]KIA82557.1 hypothetical protein OA84_10355 [Kaistella solincola]